MNTLSDLRSTLGEHAELVPDGEAVARAAAVRHRVSVVRRRRRAVGAGVLSLALLVGGAATLANRGHSDALPSAPTVLGVKAPTTMSSLGYTYRTDGTSHTVGEHGTIHLDASTQSRLLTWTTDRPTTVRLQLPDLQLYTSTVTGFHDFVVIPPGKGGTLDVRADAGHVGLAMYDVTAARPDGVTRDGITFRRTVAGAHLLTAAIGSVGQTDVRTSYVGVRGQVRMAVLCAGAPSDVTVHVAMAGTENSGGCDSTAFDPGSDSVGANRVGHVGRAVPVHVWITRSDGTTPLPGATAAHVRFGVGIYGPVDGVRGPSGEMDRTIEYGGHTWQLTRTRRSDASPIRIRIGARQPAIAMIGMRITTSKPTYLRLFATGMPPQESGFSGAGGGTSGPYWLPAGATVRATRSTPGAFAVGIYARTD